MWKKDDLMKLTELMESEYANVTSASFEKLHKRDTKGLENITLAFEEVMKYPYSLETSFTKFEWSVQNIINTIPAIEGKKFDPEDITAFSILLDAFEDRSAFNKAGIFLTDLVEAHSQNRRSDNKNNLFDHTNKLSENKDKNQEKNKTNEEEYTIITENYGKRIHHFQYLGYHLTSATIRVLGNCGNDCGAFLEGGSLIIQGNVDSFCGREMEKGSIHVLGNAGANIGTHMKNGSIHIDGNAFSSVGKRMKKGKITIQGNCGIRGGENMEGGIIHIYGDSEPYLGLEMTGGNIIVEGNAKEVYHIHNGRIDVNGETCTLQKGRRSSRVYHRGKPMSE